MRKVGGYIGLTASLIRVMRVPGFSLAFAIPVGRSLVWGAVDAALE